MLANHCLYKTDDDDVTLFILDKLQIQNDTSRS